MSSLKKITVTILGEPYHLMSDDPDHMVHDAARMVDQSLRDMRERTRGSGLGEYQLAVLHALRTVMAEQAYRCDVEHSVQRVNALIDTCSL